MYWMVSHSSRFIRIWGYHGRLHFSGTSGVINLGKDSADKLERMFKGGLEHHVAFTYGDISDKLIHFGNQMNIPTYTL